MIIFKVKVPSFQKISSVALKPEQVNTIGTFAIKQLVKRVQKSNTGIFDEPMPPYSPKPVYIKLGKSNGRAVIKSGNITIASLNSLRRAGARIIDTRNSGPRLRRAQSKIKNAVRITGSSVKFQNRAAYKRYLGKSGLRDLTETGAMLSALVVLSSTGSKTVKVIGIGFVDPVQERKAAGNMLWADWFGLSPSNQLKVTAAIEKMIAKNLNA